MDDLKIIKDNYGEKMMHLCRELFPSLLETPGVLSRLMLEHFHPSRFLYDDIIRDEQIENFRKYIRSLKDDEGNNEVITNKTPKELLDEAGYILYECKTEEEIQAFKKYYAPGEELCTFNGGRLNTCDVFFAVKKNVDTIRRTDFTNPSREDEYGTSVISIQFSKGSFNNLSIKNRYNHIVNNPDNTFNNNLDNIIPGLSNSFARQYSYNFSIAAVGLGLILLNYVNVNGKFYRYNCEFNNIYYCPNNIIIDNFTIIDKYSNEPERYIVLNYFIIDLKEKKIKLYDEFLFDDFVNEHKNIKKIIISKNKESRNKTIEIIYDNVKKATLIINSKNQLIEYDNSFLLEVGNNFLYDVRELKVLKLPNVTKIGNRCFHFIESITSLELPNLIEMGDDCFYYIDSIISLELPNLIKMGNRCFYRAKKLPSLELLKLIEMGIECFSIVKSLIILSLPNLIEMGNYCFEIADKLISLELLELTKINWSHCDFGGNQCFANTQSLTSIAVPKLETKDKPLSFIELEKKQNQLAELNEAVANKTFKEGDTEYEGIDENVGRHRK